MRSLVALVVGLLMGGLLTLIGMNSLRKGTAYPNGTMAVMAAEKKYKCQFCNRAFSRSEHRSRHERSRKSKPPMTAPNPRKAFVFVLANVLILRHQRETLQMLQVSQYLCSTRSAPSPRSHGPCQRWRGATAKRLQET